MKLLLVDNYDSFTYNIVHLFANLTDVEVVVRRNDEPFLADYQEYDGYIIGPGPGSPDDINYFGNCSELLRIADKPLLGICLGFQGLAVEMGAHLKKAEKPMHGKTSKLAVTIPAALLEQVKTGDEVMRYHSLMIDASQELPKDLVVCAEVIGGSDSSQNGREIMAISHATRPLYGVQFHPESFATICGKTIAQNFVNIVRAQA